MKMKVFQRIEQLKKETFLMAGKSRWLRMKIFHRDGKQMKKVYLKAGKI